MRQLKRLLRPLKAPRASNVRHDLVEIVVIALAAILAGAKTCSEFEFFGTSGEELLRQFAARYGIPSHDTLSNVFRALDPKGLEAVLRKFSRHRAQVGRHFRGRCRRLTQGTTIMAELMQVGAMQ